MSDSRVITASGGTLTAERACARTGGQDRQSAAGRPATERIPQACAMVIFGVSGDLTSRKLMPALYDLDVSVPLPPGFSIVGISRRDWSDDAFPRRDAGGGQGARARARHRRSVGLASRSGLFYVRGDFDDPETYMTGSGNAWRRSTPSAAPTATTSTIWPRRRASTAESSHGLGERRPRQAPGDLQQPSARVGTGSSSRSRSATTSRARSDLNAAIDAVFSEQQVYRIDHYLGKETVQNILAFRFANILFEPVWNRHYVDQVQITVAESLGVEDRGAYYEEAGALRDMVQSHMLQLLCRRRDGAARALQRRRPPRREGQSAALGRAARRRSGRRRTSCAASTRAGYVAGSAVVRLPRGRRTSIPIRGPKPSSRSSWRSTTGAGTACPSICAPASGCRGASPRSRSSSRACRT